MAVLVFAEQRKGKMPKVAFEAVSQGRRIADRRGDSLHVCLIGDNVSHLSDDITAYGGDDILIYDSVDLSDYQTEAYAAVLVSAVNEVGAKLVIMGHTLMVRDLAPRVAEEIGAGLVSDCTAMETDEDVISFIRPMYAGKVFAKVTVGTDVALCTIRPNNFSIAEKPGKGKQRTLDCEIPEIRARTTGMEVRGGDRPELTEADIIVSGGRGLGGAEGFGVVEEVADILGAAVGASRAAVDAGWRSQQYQVGQTGKVVTPDLYVACGISGAAQHMAGMSASRCIVAINKDPDANMMKVADLSIEGDLYKILSELSDQIKNGAE